MWTSLPVSHCFHPVTNLPAIPAGRVSPKALTKTPLFSSRTKRLVWPALRSAAAPEILTWGTFFTTKLLHQPEPDFFWTAPRWDSFHWWDRSRRLWLLDGLHWMRQVFGGHIKGRSPRFARNTLRAQCDGFGDGSPLVNKYAVFLQGGFSRELIE